jgi:hypothetical protein
MTAYLESDDDCINSLTLNSVYFEAVSQTILG